MSANQAKPLQLALRDRGIDFDVQARAEASGSGGSRRSFARELGRFMSRPDLTGAAGTLHRKQ
ncbi:MAG: hypothetical protein IPK97_01085 [Ahniella sp.]|nr:hypothetical protein [Ahniella sp.]